jgi:hypothetical protein
MERLSHTYDYAGNLIFIYQDILDSQKDLIKLSNQQYLYIVQTLLNPVIIIEFNSRRKRYYYHTICTGETFLIGICFINGIWKVQDLLENPSLLFVLKLAKKCLLEALISEDEIEDNDQQSLPKQYS